MKEPESMDKLAYFTQRQLGNGKVKAWVYRQNCPRCGKALMGKPKAADGSVSVRAKHYICPECSYTAEKRQYEESLKAEIKYTCPKCKFQGEVEIAFKRRKVDGTDVLVFNCQRCSERILITKRMK